MTKVGCVKSAFPKEERVRKMPETTTRHFVVFNVAMGWFVWGEASRIPG